MTKDEALEEAISALENLCEAFLLGADWRGVPIYDETVKAIQVCKEALEHPTQRNFCERCGKRASKDLYHIHTCTPPQALKQKNTP